MIEAKTDITQLLIEVERMAKGKRDFIADTRDLEVAPAFEGVMPTSLKVSAAGDELFPIRKTGHQQLGDYLGINAKYYQKMLEQAPELLATNANYWFQHEPKDKMVRILDGEVRAFLSPGYQRRDNIDLMARVVMPALEKFRDDAGRGLQVVNFNVTPDTLNLKVVFPGVQGEVKKDDVIQAGLSI